MLDPNISDEEYLYRGVVEAQWHPTKNRPSSAAFKDSHGTSVDRSGGREDQECIEALLARAHKPFREILKVQAGFCRGIGCFLHYSPIEENIYHSEIHDSEDLEGLKSSSKAKKLERQSFYCLSNQTSDT